MTRAEKFFELRPKIARILLSDWDPIGVCDVPEAQDEYDAYVPSTFQLLAQVAAVDAIAAHLGGIEVGSMGFSSPGTSRFVAARKLLTLAIGSGLVNGPYPCAACGFLTFERPPGSFDICSVCNWEDDSVQLRHPALRGGANRESLIESQRIVVARVPATVQNWQQYRRDPMWRPFTDQEWQKALATLSPGAHLPAIAPAYNESLYYWLEPAS